MKKSTCLVMIVVLAFALAACDSYTATPTVKPTRTPTLVQTLGKSVTPAGTQLATQAGTRQPTPKNTPAAPAVVSTATRVPPTTAPSANGFPQVPEAILISAPGLNSSIVSPVTISGEADSTFEQNLVAKVTGENGLIISSLNTTIQAELGKRGKFQVKLAFNVSKDQAGRVAVYNTSPKDGGLTHFSSVELTLMAGGTAVLMPGASTNEILVITQPAPSALISGGKITVEGWSGPVFENNLVVVVCGEGGTGKADPFCGSTDNILARSSTTIKAADAGQPGPFSVVLPYKVSNTVSGRVSVYFTSPRDGGLLHLTSIPVRLAP